MFVRVEIVCMDRKQQNVQVCRTSTGGKTIFGCHACEAKQEEMIMVDTDVSRFKLCSRENYFFAKKIYVSKQQLSSKRGYKTSNYDGMMIDGIKNIHFVSPIDLYHGLHNLGEMLQKCMINNVLTCSGHKQDFNQYMISLTKEKDYHNCLSVKNINSDGILDDIGLDAAFPVSVCFYCVTIVLF